jgi:hypothetical protein
MADAIAFPILVMLIGKLIQKNHAAVVHAVALSVVQYDSQNDAPLTDLFYSLEVVCNAIYQELQDCIPYGTSIPVPARQAQRKGRYTNKARALTKRREQRLERNKLIQRTCSFTNSTSNIGLSSYWLSVQSAEPKRGKPQYYRMVGGIIVTGRSSVLACYKGLYWYSMRWQAIPYGQMLANARKCSELLGAAPSCSELLRAARSCSELLGTARDCSGLLRSCFGAASELLPVVMLGMLPRARRCAPLRLGCLGQLRRAMLL